MCQLTYANLKDPFLNALVIYFLHFYGSDKNDDGTGFICTDNSIWKSMMAARRISNYGEILFKGITNNNPVPAHVRAGTWGIEVSKDNSHPFDGDHYILMHNGTLIPKNGDVPKDKSKDSDSLRFLKALDDARDKNPKGKFPEIFNSTMKDFSGKFAFIIREKKGDKDYIIRGKTADLWLSNLILNDEIVGYVINTSKETMSDAFRNFIGVATLVSGNIYRFTEPYMLKQETIFLAKSDEIKELGEAKEYVAPAKETTHTEIVPTTTKPSLTEGLSKKTGISHTNTDSKHIGDILRLSDKIYDFLTEHSLSLMDLQIIFKIMSGISLLEVTREELVLFVDYMISKLSAPRAIRKQIKNLLDGKSFPIEVYEQYDLEYPWMNHTDKSKVVKSLKEFLAKG